MISSSPKPLEPKHAEVPPSPYRQAVVVTDIISFVQTSRLSLICAYFFDIFSIALLVLTGKPEIR